MFEFVDGQKDCLHYLDHGFVRLDDVMGTDRSVASFARSSFAKDAYKSSKANQGLINYLFEERHTSPIEAGEMSFTLKIPLFVARQHMRHRTASMAELSLRYQEHPGHFYIPEAEHMCTQDVFNKQGSGQRLPLHIANVYREMMKTHHVECWNLYRKMIGNPDPDHRLAREHARGVLTVNFYTQLSWKMDTKNLFGYLHLRDSPHAQKEIRWLAQMISYFVEREFPMLYSSYMKYWKGSVSFTQAEIAILRAELDGQNSGTAFEILRSRVNDSEDLSGSERRQRAFLTKMNYHDELEDLDRTRALDLSDYNEDD